MVPLEAAGVAEARSWVGEPSGPGLLSLGHALNGGRPGLWGDHPRRPRSVVLLRRGDVGWDAFGAGDAGPAVRWLGNLGDSVALLAPEEWEGPLRRVVERLGRDVVATWAPTGPLRAGPPVMVRRLERGDGAAFLRSAPRWALRGWGTFEALMSGGGAVGVPFEGGFASLAWVFEASGRYDSLGVHTVERLRRLGLGWAVAHAMMARVVGERGKFPLWSLAAGNTASASLARRLGLEWAADQVLWRWPSLG